MTKTPPADVVNQAVLVANSSPCAKSKRGVVIATSDWQHIVALGHNAQPIPFKCDGSEVCRASCAKLCEHAEAAALRKLPDTVKADCELLHVKAVDGQLVPSGGPSCWQCSRAILADLRIGGVWLYHETGWRRYLPTEFHTLTLEASELPILRKV